MSGRADTIVAIATGAAKGGIGIVRLSGPGAFSTARKIFFPKREAIEPWPSHELLFGAVCGSDGGRLDDGYAVRMAAPNSYTGEDVVEIHAHGSPVLLERIVRLCLDGGARPAEPGEFTRRAFLNGKLDLVQAEAVAELIGAESEAEARAAGRRLEGRLSGVLKTLRENTISLLAECEADVDFPEEKLSLATRPTLLNKMQQNQLVTRDLLATYPTNQRIHTGLRVAIAGRSNVGKSSLFNALLGADRAIVTSVPGTTRDALREELVLEGRRLRLVDTAGLRAAPADEVERIGMERTSAEISGADLVLWVADSADRQAGSEAIPRNESAPEVWRVWNKIDLRPAPPVAPGEPKRRLEVSATRGDGVGDLRAALGTWAMERAAVSDDGGIANDRQRSLLDEYSRALERARAEASAGASPEFVVFELRQGFVALSRLLGENEGVGEVLDEIFSKFCIGK